MKQKPFRVIVRRDTTKDYVESGMCFLILPDIEANPGFVVFCSITGHGEGDYQEMLRTSRKVSKAEALATVKAFGYGDVPNLKIATRR